MNLIRDCLDKQLVDRNDSNMGKCDGIVMTLDVGEQPEITHIEIGAVTRANRVHRQFGRWTALIAKRLGVAGHDPFRVPWSKVVVTGVTVTVGLGEVSAGAGLTRNATPAARAAPPTAPQTPTTSVFATFRLLKVNA